MLWRKGHAIAGLAGLLCEDMHLQAGPLLKLQCPCLFAHGDQDALCPVERLTQTQQEMAQPCENIVIQVLLLSSPRRAVSNNMSCSGGSQSDERLCGLLCCGDSDYAHGPTKASGQGPTPALQGADQDFKLEQQGEATDATIQQLCGAVLKFAAGLASSGPLPVPVQPLSTAAEPAAREAALSPGDRYSAMSPCSNCRAANMVCGNKLQFDFLCMRIY